MSKFLSVATVMIVSLIAVDAFAQSQAVPAQGRRNNRAANTASTPVAVANNMATLSPENTRIDFVGTHVGDRPDPRLGGFQKFTGKIELSDDGKQVKSLTLEFQIDSIWTEFDNLTAHLKNADFFDVEKHPTARFASTSVVTNGDRHDIKGNFTLMGKTNEITLPAKISVNEKGVTIDSDFAITRKQFGMDKMLERVSDEVKLSLAVGKKTTGQPVNQNAQARGQRGRGQGRGGMNPEEFFKQMDKNGDGKLAGDEIPERMQRFLERIDADQDGAISLEEMKSMRGRRGGGNRSGQPGNDG